jgi:hypothetical protein
MFTGRKLPLTLAFTVLVALSFGSSCQGFFQPNSLVSLAVQPPSPNVILGQTTTLQAWGTFQDNTRSQLTNGVAWSSSDPTIMSIDETSGVATGVATGTATVTAAAQGLSGTASATVFIVISSLTVSPTSWSFSSANGGVTNPGFTVTANGGTDVTSTATFTPNNANITCIGGTTPVVCTATGGSVIPPGNYTIVVSYVGSNFTATVNVTVS